jgi:hypothetical protein
VRWPLVRDEAQAGHDVDPPTSPNGSFAAAAVDARIVQVMAKLTF